MGFSDTEVQKKKDFGVKYILPSNGAVRENNKIVKMYKCMVLARELKTLRNMNESVGDTYWCW